VQHTDLSSWLSQRELMLRIIRNNLLRAQQRKKHQSDKKRTERVFQVGDKVYLKTPTVYPVLCRYSGKS
jgi:hypothetical protein